MENYFKAIGLLSTAKWRPSDQTIWAIVSAVAFVGGIMAMGKIPGGIAVSTSPAKSILSCCVFSNCRAISPDRINRKIETHFFELRDLARVAELCPQFKKMGPHSLLKKRRNWGPIFISDLPVGEKILQIQRSVIGNDHGIQRDIRSQAKILKGILAREV